MRSWIGILGCSLALLLPAGTRAGAQPGTARSDVVPMYGVGDDEFLISGYIATAPEGSIAELWRFARTMGISTIQPALAYEQFDTLLRSPLRDPIRGRVIVRGLSPLQDAGIGRELQFYPFDSSQSAIYRWKFTGLAGGRSAYNAAQGGVQERIYAAPDLAPGARIAWHVAYDWFPYQTRRFPARPYDTAAQDASGLLDWYMYRVQANRGVPTFHVAVKARLPQPAAAASDAPVLRVELWYEIPRGRSYVDTSGVRRTATEDMEVLYATIPVPKSALMPSPGSAQGEYREFVAPVNLARSQAPIFGPLHGGSESRRLDVRLYWTGAETVALRSVALRDSIGELVLGNGPASVAYRDAIVANCRRLLYGPDGAGELNRSVIRLMAGIEPHPTECATSVRMTELLARELRNGLAADARIPIHNEGGTSDRGLSVFHELVESDAVFTEVLLAPPVDTSATYGDDLYKTYRQRFGFQVVQVPSLARHNGGRFQIPLLAPTAEAIERDYEPVLQIARFGQYYPRGARWPWTLGNVTRLGEGAEISERTSRRMIATVFTTCELHLRAQSEAGPLDTLMSHTPEAAELRAMVNLSLAYGARGVHYYWLGNYINHMYRRSATSNLWIGSNDSWGSNGPLTGDTLLDHADTFALTDNQPTALHPRGTPRVLIPDFHVGYGTRTRELKRLNAWLAQIGPELVKLRWRESYSIHATVPGPYIDPAQMSPRPIAPGEIVRSVSARSRGGALDVPHATYVELGLFKPVLGRGTSGSRDSLRDVHHVFVVNRRSFERPDDIDGASAEGRRLDSLAESRMVTLRFALSRRGSWRQNIIRVREIAPDTARLPLATAPRQPLDTFILADSSATVWLRPGGGALLEITYPLADLRSEGSAPGSLLMEPRNSMGSRYFTEGRPIETPRGAWRASRNQRSVSAVDVRAR